MSSDSAKIIVERGAHGVVTVTLNRPEKSNALDGESVDLLADAIATVDRDPSTRILALRAAGKHFSAGADVSSTGDSWSKPGRTIVDACTLLDNLSKPVVAIVQGACIGGGLALATCCDVVLATPDAFFAIPEVRLGVAPGPLTLFFIQAIPPRALRRYLISGERISAERALSFGLVHEIAALAQIDLAFGRLIEALLQGAPTAIADAKRIRREQTRPQTEWMLSEMEADFRRRSSSPDALEGLASFREKRPPRWSL
ncbi:MAG: enoyl-CoA hydratase-related protein [Xanthobacteraceae bacterium]